VQCEPRHDLGGVPCVVGHMAAAWSPDIWGRKAPARVVGWADPEIGKDGVKMLTLFSKPKVGRAALVTALIKGRCFFAGVPLVSFVSTQGSLDDHWSLVTFTWHADMNEYEEWLNSFKADDVFACKFKTGQTMFPPEFEKKLEMLGGVLKKLPGDEPPTSEAADGHYLPGDRAHFKEEQLIIEKTIQSMPQWAKAAGSWYSIAIQDYSKNCIKFVKNGLYGLRMVGNFATQSTLKNGPTSGYDMGSVYRASPRMHFQPGNMGAVAYDHEKSLELFLSDFFTKWFEWKQLGECECLFAIALDAECSQWQGDGSLW